MTLEFARMIGRHAHTCAWIYVYTLPFGRALVLITDRGKKFSRIAFVSLSKYLESIFSSYAAKMVVKRFPCSDGPLWSVCSPLSASKHFCKSNPQTRARARPCSQTYLFSDTRGHAELVPKCSSKSRHGPQTNE